MGTRAPLVSVREYRLRPYQVTFREFGDRTTSRAFNQILAFDTSKVTDMSNMFQCAASSFKVSGLKEAERATPPRRLRSRDRQPCSAIYGELAIGGE